MGVEGEGGGGGEGWRWRVEGGGGGGGLRGRVEGDDNVQLQTGICMHAVGCSPGMGGVSIQ